MIPFARKEINDCQVSQNFSGGQLAAFKERWQELGAPQTIIKIISGSRIPLNSKVRLIDNWRLSTFATQTSTRISQEIKLLKAQKILIQPSKVGPTFISKMFLINKSSGGVRPIFDLRNLNRNVSARKFQLISHFKIRDLQTGDWLIRIDITLAYCHVPIAESHRCLLRLIYDKELLQKTCLPFGLSSAPQIFAKVTNWIAEILCSKSMRIVVYLDDFLIASQDRVKLYHQGQEAIGLLAYLGWTINKEKCILTLCQELKFLGIVWNTQILRKLDPSSEALALQQEENVRCLRSNKRPSQHSQERPYPFTDGQLHSSCIYSEGRRDKILGSP